MGPCFFEIEVHKVDVSREVSGDGSCFFLQLYPEDF